MCKKNIFFLFFLSSLGTYELAMINPLRQIKVERSPSACQGMHDFFCSIENSLSAAEATSPDESFVIDYGTALIGLFERLETGPLVDRCNWDRGFLEHAERLVRLHRVYGLKIFYKSYCDLPLISTIIKPFLSTKKLASLRLEHFTNSDRT